MYNLSFEKVYNGDTGKLVKILELEETEDKAFINERIKATTKLFHDTIPRQNSTFYMEQTVKISKKDQSKEAIKVNRGLLGKLLSLSAKFHKPINFQDTYPLYSVLLSLVSADGTKHCTSKRKLLEIIVSKSILENKLERSCKTLVVNFIAQFRTISKELLKTFEGLIIIFKKLPSC